MLANRNKGDNLILHDKVWKYNKSDISTDPFDDMQISSVAKSLLIKRKIDTKELARKFLYPEIEDFYNPFELSQMDIAVERINEAIDKGEKICIYGDYDVDGITSTSLLIRTFRYLNYEVDYYIPDRKSEGYGVNKEALKKIKESGVSLLITVDCGITSVDEASYSKDIGLDLIITDHHECQEKLPDALALINPKKPSCNYRFDMLAGVGIALKLAHAIVGEDFINLLDELIDLAALGTIADIAPLNDENRIISKIGLEAINAYTSIGISSLIEESGLSDKEINSGHIGFMIAPKINAAGRIGSPSLAVELLTTESHERAREISKELCELNDKRQEIEKQILMEAIAYVDKNIDVNKDKILIVEGHNWHTGIIGIVSSRISEKYYRPSVILNVEDGVAKGSARSVGSFSIFEALNSCKDLFNKFGGHDQAAGLSLDASNIEELRIRINEYANSHIGEFDLIPVVKVEDKLKSSDITYKLIDELSLFEPFGVGNPKPVFSYDNLAIDQVRLLGKDKTHLKISVHDQTRMFDCLGFGMGEKFSYFRSNDLVNMAFTLEKNNFRGVETIQFMIKDIKSAHIEDDKSKDLISKYTYELFKYIDSYERADSFNDKYTNELLISKSELEDYIIGQNKLSIYINSLGGIKDFYLNYFDKIIESVSYHWGDEEVDPSKKINVFFLSTSSKSRDMDTIDIIYDECLSHEELCSYDINRLKFYNFEDEKAISKEIIRSSIPDREDLKNIYIFIKQNQDHLIYLEDIIKKTNLNHLKLLLSISLMLKEGLISGEFNNEKVKVSLVPTKEKINILETSYYKKIQAFKESYFSLKALKNDIY